MINCKTCVLFSRLEKFHLEMYFSLTSQKTWSSRRFLRRRNLPGDKEDEEAVAEDNSLKSAQHITGNFFGFSKIVVDPSTAFHYNVSEIFKNYIDNFLDKITRLVGSGTSPELH